MKELKLRGYVTPADCGGDVAKALQLAKALELNKVVLTGEITWAEPLVLTSGMYLVLDHCHLQADLVTPMEENFSFRQKFITIEGENSCITGNIHIFNTHHLNISGLKIAGNLTCEYTLWGNIHHVEFTHGGLCLGRGCGNFIVQEIDSAVPAKIDGSISCGKIIPGTKPDLNSIVFCDSRFTSTEPAVQLGAAEDCGIINIQVDHITAENTAVLVGKGLEQSPYLFQNLTFTHLSTTVEYQNPVLHAYER